ncbi:Protein phosphatase 2C, putative [Talaromyces stipitatus ATCC 10500]|uniref:protein-serine/threonine phosphatase n=1 Tax=Talaromyces stipitatus (strain ATCC 10500 / CBS 375.48 / QM 6759 / NRRL 1006) TaxID=441959 RepID=B8MJH1_TALSN|nr:Protein phosphatase 2C, putative [Talaromyces stipitatus ATCC 10500]EED15171.1 Protein phosphatase 2C, putative [Talaromyces stipitatus ATCC 10500]
MLPTRTMHIEDAVLLFDAGAATVQGGRVSQEDRHVILLPHQFPPTKSTDKFALFATYDGHGSADVSEHVRQNLPNLLIKRPEFEKGDYETAIIKSFEDEDELLLQMVMEENTQAVIAGSTVALCLVNLTKGLMVVGNVGDSHIFLARRDEGSEFITWQERLTVAHKPHDPSEKSRIEQAGGAVHTYGGTARLGTLNMSRALGDLQYKNPINNLNLTRGTKKAKRANASGSTIRGNILSNEAYVRTIKLDPNSRYTLLVCTDGVTDVTDEKQLMTEVMSDFVAGRRARDIAKMVTTATGEQPHSDNSTCVIAFLDGVRALK